MGIAVAATSLGEGVLSPSKFVGEDDYERVRCRSSCLSLVYRFKQQSLGLRLFTSLSFNDGHSPPRESEAGVQSSGFGTLCW